MTNPIRRRRMVEIGGATPYPWRRARWAACTEAVRRQVEHTGGVAFWPIFTLTTHVEDFLFDELGR